MWNVIRDLGNDETLIQCSECDYQMIAYGDFPVECPNCGELTQNLEPRKINVTRSTLDLDVEEVPVVDYERDTPAYKLWYFWVILILIAVLAFGGFNFVKTKLASAPKPSETAEVTNGFTYEMPAGWSKVDKTTLAGPDESDSIRIFSHEVSKFDKVDEFGKLVAELSEIDEVETRDLNGIDARYINWKTRKIVGKDEVYTDYARVTFISGGYLTVITFRSESGNTEVFETFLKSILPE